MMNTENQLIIDNSIPKILISLIKPFIILILAAILFLSPKLKNTHFNQILLSIGLIIITICCYQILLAFKIIIQYKKNDLLIDKIGLSLFSAPNNILRITWSEIPIFHSLIKHEQFLLVTHQYHPIYYINQYTIIYPCQSADQNHHYNNMILSDKYLNIHITDLELMLNEKISHTSHKI